jgi:leucine dehydrogenase
MSGGNGRAEGAPQAKPRSDPINEGAPQAKPRSDPINAGTNGDRPAEGLEHEELVVRRGRRTGLYVIVAVHSTALGPALGGARLWHYRAPGDAIADALRLSKAMTFKAAAAGLDLGGGKAVLCSDDELGGGRRRELMLDLGDVVESLGGRYITAEDVGTGTEDMAVIRERTSHVVGLPAALGGSGDPSPLTARGVESAIRACCEGRFGSPDLSGRRVCIVGLGHVGSRLAERLLAAGAEVVAADIDSAKRPLAEKLGAAWTDAASPMTTSCEVLAPCALGGAIDRDNLESLRCEIVCGSANNVLAEDRLAEELASSGIVYAPDFIANAGGLINVYAEIHGLDAARTAQLVDGIGETIAVILAEARERATTPLEAARELAAERLEAGRRPRQPAAA